MSAIAIEIDVDTEIPWWRPLVGGLLYIPHGVWTVILAVGSVFAALATAVMLVATGRIPERLAAFQVLALRERARTYSYFFALRTSYPPMATGLTTLDPGDDLPVRVSVRVAETAPRSTVLVRPFILIPHAVTLILLGALMDAMYGVTMVILAVRGSWSPRWAARYIAVDRWVAAVLLYASLAVNEVPRFGLSAYTDDDELPG